MSSFKALLCSIFVAALLTGCGNSEPREQRVEEGREETRSIRNTESIGYAGEAIADKVDAALDANDRKVQQAEDDFDDY